MSNIIPMVPRNDRAIQELVCFMLGEFGVPSPQDNVVVQAQRQGPDFVVRVRFTRLGVKRPATTLYPTTEHRFENCSSRPVHELRDFLDGVAEESLVLLQLEMRKYGLKYPHGWPHPNVRVVPGPDRTAIAGKALTSADQGSI